MSDAIIVVGWPRSGTTWLARLVIHYLDGPKVKPWIEAEKGLHPRSFRVHNMTHEAVMAHIDGGGKIVFTIRDPRDTATSEYFFLHNKVHSVTKMSLVRYLTSSFMVERGGWKVYAQRWLDLVDEHYNIVPTRHEALWADRRGELERILHRLDIEPDEASLDHAARVSWQFGSKRPRYIKEENYKKAEPSVLAGQPGEWRRHFGPKEKLLMELYCGGLMRKLGYA